MAELADAADSKSADRKVVGVRPPLPAPTKQRVYRENGHSKASGHFRLVPVLVHVVLFSAWACLAGAGDALDHRLSMLGRQMAVTGRHGDCLVPRSLLNLFDGCSCHRQPGAESVTVRVPNVSCNLGLRKAGLEPRAGVESSL